MVVFNYSGAEINAKVVYYGPALSGKTTNLEYIYEKMPDNAKGKMVSMKTRTDRTLFFDFLPLDVGEINGYRTRILLYTVPGQVYYNATRKLVLKGADAVVFVADSSAAKMQENLDSLRNLEENLNEHGLTLDTMPWVMQYNKRDLPDALPVEQLAAKLNLLNVPSFEAIATNGHGIYGTFRAVAGLLYRQLVERLKHTQPAPGSADGSQPAPSVSLGGPAVQKGAPGAQPPRPSVADGLAAGDTPATGENADASAIEDRTVTDVVDVALREVTTEAPGGEVPVAAEPARPLQKQKTAADEPAVQRSAGPSDKEFNFASLENPPDVQEDVGRVIDFEDTQPMERPEPVDGEFIVDPFQKGQSKAYDAPPRQGESPPSVQPAAPPAPRETSPAEQQPEASKASAATDPPPQAEPVPRAAASETVDGARIALTVPVLLKRSQIEKPGPIRIELEIRIDDEG